MNTPRRPLGTIVEMLQHIGLDVTHEYEDLVFVSNNLFILRFTDSASQIDLYFNEEIEEDKAQTLMGPLEVVGELHALAVVYKGAYSLVEGPDDSISVEFFDLLDS